MTVAVPRIFEPDYYDRMAALEAGSWWNAGMRDVARRLLDQVRVPPSGALLDVGCGSGQTMTWLGRQFPGRRRIGLDVAWHGVAAARGAQVGAVCLGSAVALPIPDRSIDLAVTLDVLQHLPLDGGDIAALTELRRVLKPGGHLFVRTNAQAFPHTADDHEYNFHKYEVPEFHAKLVHVGFSVMRLSRVNAVLGLAEIPRELRARRGQKSNYHGLLADPIAIRSRTASLKRAWLALEGRLVSSGVRLPFGRTIVALCRA